MKENLLQNNFSTASSNISLNYIVRRIQVDGKPELYRESEKDRKVDILIDFVKKHKRYKTMVESSIYK
jgi:hypothetical protein